MPSRLCLCLAVVLIAVSPVAAGTYDGVWDGDGLRVDLRSAGGKAYEGTITKAGQTFPAKAADDGRALAGSFAAGATAFDFTMSPAADGMTLRSGRTTYKLKRVEGVAPATRPADKDPLAYRVLQFPGGTIAQFDNWDYGKPGAANNVIWCDGAPRGRATDFVLRAAIGTPNAQDQANLFVAGPQLIEQLLVQLAGPAFQKAGQPTKTTCGGDEAMIQEYHATIQQKRVICRAMFVKRQDVAVAVIGLGTEQGFKEFGRAIEIVAQSITLKEAAIEPGLVGTWVLEHAVRLDPAKVGEQPFNLSQSRSITIYPNGTFADTANTGFSGQDVVGLAKGGSRGKIVKRGPTLTFQYDDGTTWMAGYELYSNGLKLDGKIYLKQ